MSTVDTLDLFTQQYRYYQRLGLSVCGFFLLLVLLAANLIHIKGAVTAAGTVVQIGKNKLVQHPNGGPVGNILVKNGDLIKQGDTLITLDSASVESQLHLLRNRDFELQLILARLQAAERGDETFSAQDAVQVRESHGSLVPDYTEIVNMQSSIFNVERKLLRATTKELLIKIAGLALEQQGIDKQLHTERKQLAILSDSIVELKDLYQRQLIAKTRLTATEREHVATLARIDSLTLSRIQNQNRHNETKQALQALQDQNKENIWEEMESTKEALSEVRSRLQIARDESQRLAITAPVDGYIHKLSINNTNAVVQPGEVILEIVPNTGQLEIHSRVATIDVDQLFLGQQTRIRLDSLDTQTTPELEGEVVHISADSTLDANTGEQYFAVHVSLSASQIQRVGEDKIISGLPVSTLFTTSERSLLNYLLKPLRVQMFSAFRAD